MQRQPSSPALAAWRAFLEAHARVTAVLERELQDECDLPLAWYDVLVQLSEAPEARLRMNELANAVLLSRAGLTRLVDRMAAAALVERIACDDDRRGTFVHLTELGYGRLRAAAPAHLRGVQEHFVSKLSPAELEVLGTAFRREFGRIRAPE